MHKCDLNYLHRKTLDDLKCRILNGVLTAGKEFYSRAELCRKFGVSHSMAHRIQQELLQMNYILLPQCGSKFIINAVSDQEHGKTRNLKKVLIIGDPVAIRDNTYGGLIVNGIREACQQHGLTFEREFVSVLNKSYNYINTSRSADAETGIILLLSMELARETAQLLFDTALPLVTVNSFFPQRSAVLPDYRLAMRQLLETAAARGAKKVMYCSGFELIPCPIIAEERECAFIEYSMFLNMQHLIAKSGNIHQLCRKAADFKPDVMLFQNDLWALHFKNNFIGKCGFTPRIFGCDNYNDDPTIKNDLTTWDTRPEAQGRIAVDVLLDPLNTIKPYVTRIKGKLIIRD